jgi:hypothetical protein
MELEATPEFLIGPMRVLTMREMTFFHVASQPVPFVNLDQVLDPLLDSLYKARTEARITEAGPDIVRYYRTSTAADGTDLFLMEVGIPVKPGTPLSGKAQIKTLPPDPFAGLLLWGSLAHIVEAYTALSQAMKQAGLEHTGECQEWNYYFEAPDSPRNLMAIYMGISKASSCEHHQQLS